MLAVVLVSCTLYRWKSEVAFLTCVAGKRVYVHCTAGLGRAPAACIAYLYWVADDCSLREDGNWSLDKARPAPYRPFSSELIRADGCIITAH